MSYNTQNSLLLNNLMKFYNKDDNLEKILPIINGESSISLRLIDWFVTNYSKKHYVIYNVKRIKQECEIRFKVYVDYKLKLKAYSKKRFDPFCRWDRITIPYKEDTFIQTTLGQLNFFRWAMENDIIKYINSNLKNIEVDMNKRNSTMKYRKTNKKKSIATRKKRQELSVSATKTIKKEDVEIIVKFN
tara:strand:+ start:407 stop:970 length:564 start_codon:yes stop_codon:yes gene_type:complete